MPQRLQTGQLIPAAKPVNQFLNYSSPNPAAPGRPSLLPQVQGVRSVGGGGGSNVGSANNIAKLQEALGSLTKIADVGLQMYASNEYKKGQNEILRAAAQINRDQRAEGYQYAAENRQLSRLDRAAGALMDEVNPYRKAGQINQVSQIAAQELPSMFRQLVAQNSAGLTSADPGSPMLNTVRAGAVKVLTDKGLDEFSPGFQDYVLPVLNREWEAFQEQHLKAWVANQKVTQRQQSQQQLYAGLMLGQDVGQLGQVLRQGAMRLGIDGEPAAFTKDVIVSTARQLQQIRDSGDPTMSQQAERALGQLALLPTGLSGENGEPIPAGQAYSFEILQGTDQVAQITRRQRDNEREDLSRSFVSVFGERMAGLEPGSPEANAVLQEALSDPQFDGLSRTEKSKLLQDAAGVEAGLAGLQVNDNLMQDQFLAWENQYGSDWNEQDANARFNALMQNLPTGASAQKAQYRKQFQELLGRKRREADGSINTALFNQNLKESLSSQLAARYPDITEAAVQGLPIEQLLGYGDSLRKAASQAYASEFRRRGYAAIRAEAAKRGVAEIPMEDQQAVLDQVLKDMTGDKALMDRLFPPLKGGQQPGSGGGGGTPGQASTPTPPPPPPGTRPATAQTFTPSRLDSVPEQRLKEWRSQPLLDATSVENLLATVLNGGSMPAAFKRAAKTAGTTPEQLLLRQVDFYPRYDFGLKPADRQRILRRGNRAQGAANAVQGAAPSQVATLLSNTTRLFADLLTGTAPAYARTPESFRRQMAGQGPVIATASTPAAFKPLANIIGGVESYGGNYGAFNRGGSNNGHTAHGSGIDPNLTGMTIAEIQRRQLAPGIPRSQHLHAVGKYQIIGKTLQALLQGRYGPTGVKPTDRFTPAVQEKLGMALARARVVPGSVTATMRGLRQEWIGLQNVSDAQLRAAALKLMRGN